MTAFSKVTPVEVRRRRCGGKWLRNCAPQAREGKRAVKTW